MFLVVRQEPRRFVAQSDKEIEGLGCLQLARKLHGICSELGVLARNSLGKRPGPAVRGTPGEVAIMWGP